MVALLNRKKSKTFLFRATFRSLVFLKQRFNWCFTSGPFFFLLFFVFFAARLGSKRSYEKLVEKIYI